MLISIYKTTIQLQHSKAYKWHFQCCENLKSHLDYFVKNSLHYYRKSTSIFLSAISKAVLFLDRNVDFYCCWMDFHDVILNLEMFRLSAGIKNYVWGLQKNQRYCILFWTAAQFFLREEGWGKDEYLYHCKHHTH